MKAAIQRHSLAIAVTAFPGLQRLIAIWLVSSYAGIEILGRVMSDLGIVTFLGFFTAIGWATTLMIQLPRLRTRRQMQFVFGVFLRTLPLIVLAIFALYILAEQQLVLSLTGSSAYLASWSVYQLVRHYYLANQQYRYLLLVDLFALALTTLGLVFYGQHELSILLVLSMPYALISIVLILKAAVHLRRYKLSMARPMRNPWGQSQGFGLSNAMSGSVVTLLPTVVRWLAGDIYAGLVSVLTNLTGILMLFPRALSIQQLVPMTQLAGKKAGKELSLTVSSFQRKLLLLLVALSAALAITWYAGLYSLFQVDPHTPGLHLAFSICLVTFFLSQVVLPHANLVTALEKVVSQLKINVASVVFFAVAIWLIWSLQLEGTASFIAILFACLFSTFIRSVAIAVLGRKTLRLLFPR